MNLFPYNPISLQPYLPVTLSPWKLAKQFPYHNLGHLFLPGLPQDIPPNLLFRYLRNSLWVSSNINITQAGDLEHYIKRVCISFLGCQLYLFSQ
jgi:hypothetical protein